MFRKECPFSFMLLKVLFLVVRQECEWSSCISLLLQKPLLKRLLTFRALSDYSLIEVFYAINHAASDGSGLGRDKKELEKHGNNKLLPIFVKNPLGMRGGKMGDERGFWGKGNI